MNETIAAHPMVNKNKIDIEHITHDLNSFKKDVKSSIDETKENIKTITEHVIKIRERVFDGLSSNVKTNKENLESMSASVNTSLNKLSDLFIEHIKDHEKGASRAQEAEQKTRRWLIGIMFTGLGLIVSVATLIIKFCPTITHLIAMSIG